MKSPFYFLFLILIFLTACKQESKKSTEHFRVSKNKNVNTPPKSVPKNEKEKLAPKIDSKKQENKFPFPPPPSQNFDEITPPILIENTDDIRSNGNYYSPEKIQQGDVFQEEPLLRTNISANKQDEPYTIVDENAEFPGGKIKFLEYIEKNMKLISEMEVGGKCYLRFVVDLDGSISNVVILKGVESCPQCEKEAKRLIENMPNWIPAKINGKKVKSISNIAVKFE
jgi:protein TonB